MWGYLRDRAAVEDMTMGEMINELIARYQRINRPADSLQTGAVGEGFAGDAGRWPGGRADLVASNRTPMFCRKATTAAQGESPQSRANPHQHPFIR